MTTYKLAHLGCGWRGREHIGAIVKAGPRLQLVGLCDKADEQRRLGAETAGGDVGLYDNAERMLVERRPDVFSFCTLPNLRWPLVELALRHGVRAIVVE